MISLICFVTVLLHSLLLNTVTAQPARTLIYAEPYIPSITIDRGDPSAAKDAVKQRLMSLIFDPLVGIGQGGGRVPILVSGTIETIQPKRRYTVRLSNGISWHNNSPFTAEDVRFTYNMVKQYDTFRAHHLQWLNVEVHDNQLTFAFAEPYYWAEELFPSIRILPQREYQDGRFSSFVGTGSYQLLPREGTNLQLIRNPRYTAGIERITIQRSDPTVAMNDLQSHTNSHLIPDVSPSHANILEGDPAITVRAYNTTSFHYLAYNLRNSPFWGPSGLKVRKALTMAINMGALVRTTFTGAADTLNGPFPPGSPFYNSQAPFHSYNPQRAQQLLREANFNFNQELVIKAPTQTRDVTEPLLRAIIGYWLAINVRAKLVYQDYYQWEEDLFRTSPPDFQIAYGVWFLGGTSDIRPLFYSRGAGGNFIGYNNPTVDGLLDNIVHGTSVEEIVSHGRELHRIIAEECPYTFLCSVVQYVAWDNRRLDLIDPYQPSNIFERIKEWRLRR